MINKIRDILSGTSLTEREFDEKTNKLYELFHKLKIDSIIDGVKESKEIVVLAGRESIDAIFKEIDNIPGRRSEGTFKLIDKDKDVRSVCRNGIWVTFIDYESISMEDFFKIIPDAK